MYKRLNPEVINAIAFLYKTHRFSKSMGAYLSLPKVQIFLRQSGKPSGNLC